MKRAGIRGEEAPNGAVLHSIAGPRESELSRATRRPGADRRVLLEDLCLGGGPWIVAPVFEDGDALFASVAHGLEGIVCKRRSQPYRPGERGWIKVKNRAYWRYRFEVESLQRSLEHGRSIA